MGMAAGLDVGIDADRDTGSSATALHLFARFIEQDIEFSFGFDIEEQKPSRFGTRVGAITEGFANFLARFANSGKNYFVAGNTEMAEVFEFTPGNDIKAAAKFRQLLEDGEISVGFDGETERVGKRAEAFLQFEKSGLDRGAAVDISGRGKFFGGLGERDIFAEYFFARAPI